MLILRKLRERVGAIPRTTVRREARKSLRAALDCRTSQRRVLKRLLKLNGDSHFSRQHGLDQVDSVAEFRHRLPICDYEYFRPYIQQVQLGRQQALLGSSNPLLMFSLSSGTTGQSKLIPVTRQFLKDYRRGWQTWGIHTLDDHPSINIGKILQYSSDYDQFRTAGGFPCGNISGLVASMQKPIVRTMYTVPHAVAKIHETDPKNYTFLRIALADEHVAMMVTANPGTLLHLAKLADRSKESLIRDIADGTLSCSHLLAESVRRKLVSRLRPHPHRARQLEQLAEREGALRPKDYWPALAALAVWTGGSARAYLPSLGKQFGEVALRDHGLSASEGRMTVPLRDNQSAGILEVGSHFFEFIPEEEYANPQRTVLEAHELQQDRNYYILLTTSSGLYRYDICDVVRCVGFFGTTPVLEFLHKGANISNLTGEKLTESQIVSAVCASTRGLPLSGEHFAIAPAWGEPPWYEFFIEQSTNLSPELRGRLAGRIDRQLQDLNCEYRDKRNSGRLDPLRCVPIPEGTWASHTRREQKRRGSSPDQYKHTCLVPDLNFRERLLQGMAPVSDEPNGAPVPVGTAGEQLSCLEPPALPPSVPPALEMANS